jgi:hypothetical protein
MFGNFAENFGLNRARTYKAACSGRMRLRRKPGAPHRAGYRHRLHLLPQPPRQEWLLRQPRPSHPRSPARSAPASSNSRSRPCPIRPLPRRSGSDHPLESQCYELR